MIRLLGTIFLVTFLGVAACSSSGGGNGECKDIASSLTTGGDGIPEVSGEVVTTTSCIQIIDFEVGEGESVQPGEIISISYTGYLEDGTIFGTTTDRGEPIAFSLDRVFQGWQEGIPGMKVDGKRRLIIPAELNPGTLGFGLSAPPDVTLIFDIELLEIAR